MALDSGSRGVFVIAPTPFHEDGRVDERSIDTMTDFFLQAGCDGLTILGMMGEAQKLEPAEAIAISRQVIRRAAGAPIVVGVSAPGFAAMRTLAREVMDLGAAGVMIAPPPSLRTDDQIAAYFRQAAAAIGPEIPFVLQDFPLATNVVMTPSVICRVVTENVSCVMLKHEDWPGLDKISALRAFEAEGSMRPISILCGNGGLFLDFETERGADGAMTGYAFPDMLVDVVRLAREGKREAAHDLFDAHLPLLRYEQQPGEGLAIRKHVLHLRGVIASSAQRAPGSTLGERARTEVTYLLDRLARIDPRAKLAS